MRGQGNTIRGEAAVAKLARGQAGAVSRRQLADAGVSPRAIDRLRDQGVLTDIHRGVYLVAAAVRTRATLWHAALLTSSEGGAISHADALAAWGCANPSTGPVHLTSSQARKQRAGIHLHRSPLPPGDWALRDGLRLTTMPRTLIDLAPTFTTRELQRAIDEAHFNGLVSATTLQEALERNKGRPGVPQLKTLLRTHELGTTRTTTDLEEHVYELLVRTGLTGFISQAPLGPYTADFLYPAERLIVEADGGRAHRRRTQRQHDTQHDAYLRQRGYDTVRITEDEAYDNPEPALERVLSALTRRRAGNPANASARTAIPTPHP